MYWWEKPEWWQIFTYYALAYDYRIFPDAYTYQGDAWASQQQITGTPGNLVAIRGALEGWLSAPEQVEMKMLSYWLNETPELDPQTLLPTGNSVYFMYVQFHGSPFPWAVILIALGTIWLVDVVLRLFADVLKWEWANTAIEYTPLNWSRKKVEEAGEVVKQAGQSVGEVLTVLVEAFTDSVNKLASGLAKAAIPLLLVVTGAMALFVGFASTRPGARVVERVSR